MHGSDCRREHHQVAGKALIAALLLWFVFLLPATWLVHANTHGSDDTCELCPALNSLHNTLGTAPTVIGTPQAGVAPMAFSPPAPVPASLPHPVARGPPGLPAA